jgi:hypothetical protein
VGASLVRQALLASAASEEGGASLIILEEAKEAVLRALRNAVFCCGARHELVKGLLSDAAVVGLGPVEDVIEVAIGKYCAMRYLAQPSGSKAHVE